MCLCVFVFVCVQVKTSCTVCVTVYVGPIEKVGRNYIKVTSSVQLFWLCNNLFGKITKLSTIPC